MSMSRRISKLEASHPPPAREPWVVRVFRSIVRPGPSGPVFTGETLFSEFVEGKLVNRSSRKGLK